MEAVLFHIQVLLYVAETFKDASDEMKCSGVLHAAS